jgi:hypothetical protein
MGKDNSETLRAIITTMIRKDAARPNVEDLGVALGMRIEAVEEILGREAYDLGLLGGNAANSPSKEGGQFDDRIREDRTDRISDSPDKVTDKNFG